MIVLLFVGAAVQWFVAGLSTRYLARGNAGGTLVSIVVLQAIWFCNIGPVTESRTWASMAAWTLGSGVGASAAIYVSAFYETVVWLCDDCEEQWRVGNERMGREA